MSKKIKALVAVMVAILVLTAGSAAMVMAQDEEPPPPPPEQEAEANPFLQKIAEIQLFRNTNDPIPNYIVKVQATNRAIKAIQSHDFRNTSPIIS